MAIPAIVALVTASFVIAAASATFLLISQKSGAAAQEDSLSPQSLDDFNVTKATEGSVVPLVYGKVRIAGNILWYGNLLSQETYQYGGGGGGGKGGGGAGGGSSLSGYRYFLDIWQSLCIGKATFTEAWVNNQKVVDISIFEPIWTYVAEQFNDGTNGVFPTIFDGNPGPGSFVNAINGVCHIYWHWYLIGENTTNMPTIHFLIEKILEGPLVNQNLTSGSNPSGIILDLLKIAGIPDTKIDLVSFEEADVFFKDKDYGMNVVFNKIAPLSSMINRIAGLVDAVVQSNTEGKYQIRFRDPLSAPDAFITTNDILDLKVRRTTYAQVPNDFKATYIEETQEYTKRTVVVQNQAALLLNRNIITESIDLTAFRTALIASKRITEIMKNNSFPALEMEMMTFLKFDLFPGDKVSVDDTKLGLSSVEFWVTEVSHKDIDKNEIGFKGRQVTENLFDDTFQIIGGSENVPIDSTLAEFTNILIFELPYRTTEGFQPTYLLAVAREKAIETGFSVQLSQEASANFEDFNTYSTFSQTGFLDELYPVTREIDLEQGILYTPISTDVTFDSVSEAQLYTLPRFAIIGDEMLAFQTVTPESGGFRLTKVIRGILNTPVSSHAFGVQIWLVNLGNNVLSGVDYGVFFLKFIPIFTGQTLDPATVSSKAVVSTNKAKVPRKPGLVSAIRTPGDLITVLIYPNSPDVVGTGDGVPINVTDSPPPFPFTGELLVQYDAIEIVLTPGTTSTSFTKAGAFSLTVLSRRSGSLSDPLVLSVDAPDGEYLV